MLAVYISETDGVVLGSGTHLHILSTLSTSGQGMREWHIHTCVYNRGEGSHFMRVFTFNKMDKLTSM